VNRIWIHAPREAIRVIPTIRDIRVSNGSLRTDDRGVNGGSSARFAHITMAG